MATRDARFEYGHFTTLRVEADGVRGLALHQERLDAASRELFPDAEARLDLAAVLGEAVAHISLPATARVTVTSARHELSRPGTGAPRAVVETRAAPALSADPAGALRLTTRSHVRSLFQLKHVAIAPELRWRMQAQRAGFDDCLFLDPDGHVVEGPTWALGLLRGGTLVVPTGPSLPSVTMRLIEQVAGQVGLDVAHEPVPVAHLPQYDAAFLANAAIGLRPVASVDAAGLDAAEPMLAALLEAYRSCPRDVVSSVRRRTASGRPGG